MSMISAQIDELRKWADQLSERENEFGVVVRALAAALRDAADTIWQLRDDLQRTNAENAKLRELVEDMLDCIEIRAAWHRPPTEKMCEEFARRARELEVEVDE